MKDLSFLKYHEIIYLFFAVVYLIGLLYFAKDAFTTIIFGVMGIVCIVFASLFKRQRKEMEKYTKK